MKKGKIEKRQSFYQILDVGVCLESDSTEFLELFDRDYGWFRKSSINSTIGNSQLSISAQLRQKDAFVRINNKIFSLDGHPNKNSYVYQIILKGIFEEIRNFLLLHAGVAARDGEAVIVAGPPGAGKTTLVLKLLERGFTFFSDDFCPVHKESGLVYPFPRTIMKRPSIKNRQSSIVNQKLPIRPDQLRSPVATEPCRAKRLICLDPGGNSDPFCELEIGLKQGAVDAFWRELKQLSIINYQSSVDTEFSEWRIKYPKDHGLTEKVKEILEKYEQQIWNVYRVDAVHPDFTREPILTPIPNHEAAFRLLRDLKQGPGPGPFQNGDTRRYAPGELFMELNRLLEGVPCYKLSAGSLDGMVGISAELFLHRMD